jgi:hypothetical protein
VIIAFVPQVRSVEVSQETQVRSENADLFFSGDAGMSFYADTVPVAEIHEKTSWRGALADCTFCELYELGSSYVERDLDKVSRVSKMIPVLYEEAFGLIPWQALDHFVGKPVRFVAFSPRSGSGVSARR